MKTECEVGITIPLSKEQKRVAEATRVSRRTLCVLLKEGKNVETGVAMVFSTPRKFRLKFAPKWSYRISMRLFTSPKKQRQTLKAIHSRMCDSTGYGGGLSSANSCRMNWRRRQFKWTRPFRRKTKSDFCACAITFQTQSSNGNSYTFYTQIYVYIQLFSTV